MTDERIRECEALYEAATPGPWEPDAITASDGTPVTGMLLAMWVTRSLLRTDPDETRAYSIVRAGKGLYCSLVGNGPKSEANAAFIAAARTALPEALSALREAKAREEALRGIIGNLCSVAGELAVRMERLHERDADTGPNDLSSAYAVQKAIADARAAMEVK